MEQSKEKEYLTRKLQEAGASGKKLHVIFRRGHWTVISESSARALGIFRVKNTAIKKANTFLDRGITDAVIVHNKDGSVVNVHDEKYLHLQDAG